MAGQIELAAAAERCPALPDARLAGPGGVVSTPAMSDDDPLDRLSSKELHDLAVAYARRHLDLGFFLRLIEYLPVAEAAAGEWDEAEADVEGTIAHVDDITDAGRGETADLLRPVYLEYLREHAVRPE
jgi:hypothetical protein